MAAIGRLRAVPGRTQMKIAASLLLGLPAVLLIGVALLEIASGEPSGAQHIPEGALLLLVAAAGWRYPRAAGGFLVAVGTVLVAAWMVLVSQSENAPEGADIWLWILVGIVLFAPPIVAGWLLWRAGGGGAGLLPR